MPLSQVLERIAFAGGILLIVTALFWSATGGWWNSGRTGRTSQILTGTAIVVGTLHSLFVLSEPVKLVASIASVLLVIAAFMQRGNVETR